MYYFDKIFREYAGSDPMSVRYPYSIRNLSKRNEKQKDELDAFRESLIGLSIRDIVDSGQTLSEALGDGQMGTSLLSDYIPQVFTDQIVQFGMRTAVARRDFPMIQQSTNSDFRHRFRFRHDSAGIYREGDNIYHATTKRKVEKYAFVKIADSMAYTREFLQDSPIDEIALDLQASSNKQAMLEDRCMFHEFLYWSDSEIAPEFFPYNFCKLETDEYDGAPTAEQLLDAMESAYLKLTTRQEDQIAPSDLRFYVTPAAYTLLWKSKTLSEFQRSGRQAQVLQGELPPFFGVPMTVTSLGFFDVNNQWRDSDFELLLVGSGSGAIRVRTDMRMEPFQLIEKQMEGWITSERWRPYIINPIRYCRISRVQSNPIKTIEDVLYRVQDLSKTEDSVNMISVNE